MDWKKETLGVLKVEPGNLLIDTILVVFFSIGGGIKWTFGTIQSLFDFSRLPKNWTGIVVNGATSNLKVVGIVIATIWISLAVANWVIWHINTNKSSFKEFLVIVLRALVAWGIISIIDGLFDSFALEGMKTNVFLVCAMIGNIRLPRDRFTKDK